MPRARINVPDDEVVVKKPRAPRKPRVISSDTISTPKPRKRTSPKVIEREEEVPEPTRKAPTAIASSKRRQKRSSKVLVIVAIFCVILTGLGVGLGLSDKGEINVVAVVNDRNEKINRGEVRDEKTGEVMSLTIPVQKDDRPNGGLKLSDTQPDQINTPPPPEQETATSSEAGTVSTTTLPEPNPESTSTEPKAVN